MNVSTDRPVCILLKFTFTNTWDLEEVECFDNCSHVVEYSHARDRDAAVRYTKLRRTKC